MPGFCCCCCCSMVSRSTYYNEHSTRSKSLCPSLNHFNKPSLFFLSRLNLFGMTLVPVVFSFIQQTLVLRLLWARAQAGLMELNQTRCSWMGGAGLRDVHTQGCAGALRGTASYAPLTMAQTLDGLSLESPPGSRLIHSFKEGSQGLLPQERSLLMASDIPA